MALGDNFGKPVPYYSVSVHMKDGSAHLKYSSDFEACIKFLKDYTAQGKMELVNCIVFSHANN